MSTAKTVPAELLEQLRHDREKIATELPELKEHAANGSTRPPPRILSERSPAPSRSWEWAALKKDCGGGGAGVIRALRIP